MKVTDSSTAAIRDDGSSIDARPQACSIDVTNDDDDSDHLSESKSMKVSAVELHPQPLIGNERDEATIVYWREKEQEEQKGGGRGR